MKQTNTQLHTTQTKKNPEREDKPNSSGDRDEKSNNK